MSTNLVEEAMNKMSSLPLDKQREVLDFVEFVAHRVAGAETPQPHHSIIGMFADRGINLTAEDIDESRREMLANFPRDDF